MKKIAIIGAGITGLTLAKQLEGFAQITIFDKSRGIGGRMSTRRAEPFHFDHGTPFFKIHHPLFKEFLQPFEAKGIVTPWQANIKNYDFTKQDLKTSNTKKNEQYYVASPTMNALCKSLASNLDIRLQTEITEIQNENNVWTLLSSDGQVHEHFDWVIATTPVEQAAAIMPKAFCHHAIISNIKMDPCFSLMLGFEPGINIDFDLAFIENSDIKLITVNNTKPGRNNAYSIVAYSTPDWALNHLEDTPESNIKHLSKLTSSLIGHDAKTAKHTALHRWRYARSKHNQEHLNTTLCDKTLMLGVCGDWAVNGDIEAAFTSAIEMAQAIKSTEV